MWYIMTNISSVNTLNITGLISVNLTELTNISSVDTLNISATVQQIKNNISRRVSQTP